jgi:cytochrome bd-type quinol oxidase subunit 2
LSDISIRVDGLLLALFIIGGGGLFAAIAILSAVWILLRTPPNRRSWRIPAFSSWLVLAHVVALLLLIAYLNAHHAPWIGPDWIDWLMVPWACFMLAGLILLVRRRRPRATPANMG